MFILVSTRCVFLILVLLFLRCDGRLSPDVVKLAEETINEIKKWAIIRNGSESQDSCGKDKCDAEFWNAITCSAGCENFACQAVLDVQMESGRFYRSIWQMNQTVDSFSRDLGLSTLLQFIETKNIPSFQKWIGYINKTQYLCPNDLSCVLTPQFYCIFERVTSFLGIYPPDISVVPLNKDYVREICEHDDDFLFFSAEFNVPGSGLHLTALEILMRYKMNSSTDTVKLAGNAIAKRQPKNFFFKFLGVGHAEDWMVIDLVKKLPKFPHDREEWIFEKEDIVMDERIKKTMGWDIIWFFEEIMNHSYF